MFFIGCNISSFLEHHDDIPDGLVTALFHNGRRDTLVGTSNAFFGNYGSHSMEKALQKKTQIRMYDLHIVMVFVNFRYFYLQEIVILFDNKGVLLFLNYGVAEYKYGLPDLKTWVSCSQTMG